MLVAALTAGLGAFLENARALGRIIGAAILGALLLLVLYIFVLDRYTRHEVDIEAGAAAKRPSSRPSSSRR